ncbi:MAG: hypothetical protein J5449_09790 [Oscillospiraceae bacterium]|nr:hypothetical protein [Oscillospiraceae bacterium]
MKQKLRDALAAFHRYNGNINFAAKVTGFDPETLYDALVVAPTWDVPRVIRDDSFCVTPLHLSPNDSEWLVERDGVCLAWITPHMGAGSVLDHLTLCAELRYKTLLFVGSAGGLAPGVELGSLYTPEWCVDGVGASRYLRDQLSDYVPFGRIAPPDAAFVERVIASAAEGGYTIGKAPVFCTDSFSFEYLHLPEIKATGAKLIEMETAAFYAFADLMEVPAAALLVVSDNSAVGVSLFAKTDEEKARYYYTRERVIPELLLRAARS